MQAESKNIIEELATEHPKCILMFYFSGIEIQRGSFKQVSGKNKKHFSLNSLMQDDREWLMPTVSQLSKIQIKAAKRCKTPHHQAIEDQV